MERTWLSTKLADDKHDYRIRITAGEEASFRIDQFFKSLGGMLGLLAMVASGGCGLWPRRRNAGLVTLDERLEDEKSTSLAGPMIDAGSANTSRPELAPVAINII